MRSINSILLTVVLLGGGFGAWYWNDHLRRPVKKVQPVPVVKAAPADFEVTLLVTGTLEPAGVHPVVAVETNGMVLQAVRDGARVNQGDVIVKLDPQDLQDRLDQVQDQLKKAEERVDQAQRNGEKSVENAKSGVDMAQERLGMTQAQNAADLEKAQAQLDYAKKETEYADGLLAKKQRLFEEGLATRQQLDAEKDNARAQSFSFEEAQRSLSDTKRKADEQEQSAKMDLEKAKLDLGDAETGKTRSMAAAKNAQEGLQRQLEDVNRQLEGCVLRTGVPGVVLLGERWDENGPHPLRAGDRVWQGMQVALVIDPKHVRVDCEIDEIDIRRIKSGQKVRLRVETAPGKSFPGTLESVDNIANESPWWRGGTPGKKTFAALVAVDAADARLRPGISAWLEIVVDKVEGKVAVPVEAVFRSKGREVVYRRKGAGFEAVPVTLGARNDLYCAVLKGISIGDEVAKRRPPDGAVVTSG